MSVENLFLEMYKLTESECGKCRVPYSCCSAEYCQMAKEYAKDVYKTEPPQVRDEGLLYLSENGCILEPHLRPLCTLHTCQINSVGSSGNLEWDEKYFELRWKIASEIEMEEG